MLLPPFTFHSPASLKEALKLYHQCDDARILAGGTFLLNNLKLFKKRGIKAPKNIISLRKIKELNGIHLDGDHLTIKAMTTIHDLFVSELLTDNLLVIKSVCRDIATTPIRNMATVGGNLTCRYTWTEMGTVMIALDARMHFIGKDGKEEVLSAEEFFKNAAKTGKIFSHVSIKRDPSAVVSYRRVKKTLPLDIPLLAVCIKTNLKGRRFTNTRVAVNGGEAFAQRDTGLEKFLDEGPSPEHTAREALESLDMTVLGKKSDDYKKHIFRVSIKHAITELQGNHGK